MKTELSIRAVRAVTKLPWTLFARATGSLIAKASTA
jgi:hypothetical protein